MLIFYLAYDEKKDKCVKGDGIVYFTKVYLEIWKRIINIFKMDIIEEHIDSDSIKSERLFQGKDTA